MVLEDLQGVFQDFWYETLLSPTETFSEQKFLGIL